ncbi:hypothetical protein [Pseudalkalibacillus hwajinpoensis]|uniref:hypothetical protein n=1 Tax=Guptibacillus hwajinpoensis TaxID=208199 RepID=UPI001CD3A487|nr:hypothetical protein [Pseudalkalibacillus hwajinpoensis]MCA0993386.1 hypothetical protein [Pseudalkalibacillus hwajinpoensis]
MEKECFVCVKPVGLLRGMSYEDDLYGRHSDRRKKRVYSGHVVIKVKVSKALPGCERAQLVRLVIT